MSEWCTDATLNDSLWKEEEDETLHLGSLGSDRASLNSPLGISEEWTKVYAKERDAHTWSFKVDIVWMNVKESCGMNVGSLRVADEDMIPGPVS